MSAAIEGTASARAPLVAVITPAYNAEVFIAGTIAAEDTRVRLVGLAHNSGVARARDAALAVAKRLVF